MKTLSILFALALLLLTNPVRVFSDTTFVSGVIVNQNWNSAGSPYVVTGDILVAGLSIDPGVSVLFAGNYVFQVQGILEAIGTEQEQITFTTKTGVSSWKGILFQNSNNGTHMKWCIVEKANTSGIRIIESLPNLNKCTIRNNTATPFGGGMYISNTIPGTLIITHCNVENNLANANPGVNSRGGGAYVISGNVDLVRCKFFRNRTNTQHTTAGGSVTAQGGGLEIVGGNVNINNCSINENMASATNTSVNVDAKAAGGGISIRGGVINIKNSIIASDTIMAIRGSGGSTTNIGAGIYCEGGQTLIENSTIVRNNREGLYRASGTVVVCNSIIYFNNNNSTQITGTVSVTYSDIQGGFAGTGNINFAPILDSTLKVVFGSLCADAGKDSVVYNDGCRPPGLGSVRNDMGAHGGPGNCYWLDKNINLQVTALMEGLYNPGSNQMSRPQVQRVYLKNATSPYQTVEVASGTIGVNGISSLFKFNASPTGTYYIVLKNFNCLETWSRTGGELLNNNGTTQQYDFTNAISKAYGNNLIQKGSRYCIFSGDVYQDGFLDASDLASIDNHAAVSADGYINSDLTGDYFVDGSDLIIADNNASNNVSVMRP